MRKEFNEDFDLQIRSMMEEAQEPAPAGAWEAISSRLDALQGATASAGAFQQEASRTGAAAIRPVRRVWYWAGAALAAAAAVALGIFFTGTSDNNSNLIDINSGTGLVAENIAPSEVAVLSDAAVPDPAAAPRVQQTADLTTNPEILAPRNQNRAEMTTTPEARAATAVSEPAVAPESPAALEVTAKEAPASTTAEGPDPLALMAFEDARNTSSGRRGISLLVKGGSTGNNAGASKLPMAAPGAYRQSGITETSKSSFGVPLIAGLGVRLHLNDVLSIGTGVDYSLLTRSFEGRYVEGLTILTGDFNHTLQYVGVPIDFFVKLIDKNDITLYSVVGTEAEKAVSNKYRLLGTDLVVGDRVNGLQWSVGAGLGLEFNVGQRVGIFAEPSVKYYFNCDQPKSLRTDKPFQMVLRAGLRFDL